MFCVAAVITVAALFAYQRVGWTRMEATCNADGPNASKWQSIEYGWSWSPPGIQCTYDTGEQRTSLWF